MKKNITDEIVKFQAGVLGSITYYAAKNVFVDGRYYRMLTNSYRKATADDPLEDHLGFFQMAIGYRF
jgi:hypothetical protein